MQTKTVCVKQRSGDGDPQEQMNGTSNRMQQWGRCPIGNSNNERSNGGDNSENNQPKAKKSANGGGKSGNIQPVADKTNVPAIKKH